MKKNKILLIGETCVDEFIYGNCERLNPEAPTPVFRATNTTENFGMAGNVEANFKHLGVDYDIITNDEKITKTRYVDVASNYILLRVDDEPTLKPISINTMDWDSLRGYDAIVISDYDKGLLSKKYLDRLFMFCKAMDTPTFMDTKKTIGGWASECTYIKINEKEYTNPKHYDLLSSIMFRDNLIVTLGERGSLYKENRYPTNKVAVRDVVGAGDTYLVGLVYGYLKHDIETAISLAGRLSTNVVSKKGVALPDLNIINK